MTPQLKKDVLARDGSFEKGARVRDLMSSAYMADVD
jgi:hypothetical protein